MTDIKSEMKEMEPELIEFVRDLVRIKSYSGDEEKIIRFIRLKMESLGFDQVTVDAMGNLAGRIGNGEKIILFDSHIDTVEVNNRAQWTHDPFGGEIRDNRIYGRGSVDMKSGAAASVYAAALAKRLGLDRGKTIFVSCTVMEEDCDGENLKHLFRELDLCPHYAVICEPSDNRLVTGHKGKAQVLIKTQGRSAHGSAPEKGMNAIYEMAQIIERIKEQDNRLRAGDPPHGTLVASRISSKSESLNAVPFECEIYLDRRMVMGETKATIKREMDALVKGKKAAWEIGTLKRRSWTGMNLTYEPFHLPWSIDSGHVLSKACVAAFKAAFKKEPEKDYWDFSTNAVTPTAMGIPTIGFGPGEYKLAHMANESCEVGKIVDACEFYTHLVGVL